MLQEKNTALSFPKAGECKTFGFAGEMIDFTVQKQYLDRETWRVLVNQFRIHSDVDNDWRGEFWGKLMRGASLTYRATKNEQLYAVLVETVLDLLSTQEPNGRISSYPQEKELLGWDMWSRKYVMLGLEYFLEICKSKALHEKVLKGLARDERFEEITSPVHKRLKNGGVVRAKVVKNPLFYSNLTVKIPTKAGEITLCDYSQAGKNYDDEHCNITVWQERKR